MAHAIEGPQRRAAPRARVVTRPTLVYGFDPLCGWCFVFAPSLAALRRELEGRVDIELACGGLVVGERVRSMAEMRPYLRSAIPEAEARSGVRFGAGFTEGLLLRDEVRLASEPACRALFAARSLGASSSQLLDYATQMIEALYQRGEVTSDIEPLARAASAVGLDGGALRERWDSAPMRAETEQEFAAARALGVSMYPSLLLRRGEQVELILRGFATPAQAVSLVEAALARTRPS